MFQKVKQKIFLSTLKMHEKKEKPQSSASEMQKIILCMDTERLMLVLRGEPENWVSQASQVWVGLSIKWSQRAEVGVGRKMEL